MTIIHFRSEGSMKITRQTEYAIRTLLELSRIPFGELLQTRVIAEKQGIPEVFLKDRPAPGPGRIDSHEARCPWRVGLVRPAARLFWQM